MNRGVLAELQSEVWAMEPRALEALLRKIASAIEATASGGGILPVGTGPITVVGEGGGEAIIPLSSGMIPVSITAGAQARALAQDSPRNPVSFTEDGVATIQVRGVLMKSVPWIFDLFGISASSYSEIASQVKAVAGMENIHSIALVVDSPGGQVSGIERAAEAIAAARASGKKTLAIVDDLAASAAYWLASQAEKISASENAMVGSIGVYAVYVDASKAAEKAGLEVHVVRSGDHKGVGTMGAPITEKQLEALQATIDGLGENFVAAVAKGRGMKAKTIQGIADGRTWIAKDAFSIGLVDRVESFDSALAGFRPATQTEGGLAMSQTGTQTAPDPKELEAARETAVKAERERTKAIAAAFPNDPSFATEQIAKGNTLAEAKAEFSDVLQKRLVEKEAELAKAKAAPATGARGAQPVGSEGTGDEEALSFMAAARARAEEKGCSLREAMSFVARAYPALYQAHKDDEFASRSTRRTR